MVIDNTWSVRPARVEDASAIANCFGASYTANYPYRTFCDPTTVESAIADPKVHVLSLVHRQDVVGTASVVQKGHRFELGRAVIHPDHRHLRNDHTTAFRELVQKRLDYCASREAPIVHCTGVTSHPATQKVFDDMGFVSFAFEHGKYGDLYGVQKRDSTFEMVYTGNLATFRPSNKPLVIPAEAQPVVARNMNKIGIEPVYSDGQGHCRENTRLHYEHDPLSRQSVFLLNPGNKGLGSALYRIHAEVEKPEVDYVQVKLEANSDLTPPVFRSLLDEEFTLGGFLPAWIAHEGSTHDLLVMQKLKVPIDPSKIYVGVTARELMRLIGSIDEVLSQH